MCERIAPPWKEYNATEENTISSQNENVVQIFSNSIMSSSFRNEAPTLACNFLTTPVRVDLNIFCIFIASTIHNSCPTLTLSPSYFYFLKQVEEDNDGPKIEIELQEQGQDSICGMTTTYLHSITDKSTRHWT